MGDAQDSAFLARAAGTAWPGLGARRSLVLPVPRAQWSLPPGTRIIDGLAFEPKPELHITLAGRDTVAALDAVLGPRRAEDLLREAFARCDWRWRRTHRYLRLHQVRPTGPDAGAIIEPLELPGLTAFHRALAAAGLDRPVPPAHVTLWTHARPQGIGIADAAALRRIYVREVTADELGL